MRDETTGACGECASPPEAYHARSCSLFKGYHCHKCEGTYYGDYCQKCPDGLMSLVDEHYPETIFPTEPDREDRDSGPRVVSLLRRLNALLEAAERPDGGTQ